MRHNPTLLTVCNGFGRLLNFALYMAVANIYGASQVTDWFFFVYAVAYFLLGICYYATESALVPAWHQLPENEHLPMFNSAVHLAFYAFPAVGLLLFVSGFFFAPRQGIGLPGSWLVAVAICLVLALQPSLAFLSSFFSSYRQSKRQYVLPTMHLTLRTVGVLIVLLLIPRRSVMVLALAYLAGEVLRLGCLSYKQLPGIGSVTATTFTRKNFWSVYGHVFWMTLALMFTVINPVIDLAMVGRFPGGTVTLVEYAGRLRGMPVLALGGLLVYFLGEWSHQHHQMNGNLQWKQVRVSFLKLVFFCLPVVVLLMMTEKIWLPLVFFSRKFGPQELHRLRQLLYWYFPGVPFLAGAMILSRALLVVQQAKLMTFITLAAAGLNVVFNLLFIRFWGLLGVALSTTLVDVFVCGMYYFFARQVLERETRKVGAPETG